MGGSKGAFLRGIGDGIGVLANSMYADSQRDERLQDQLAKETALENTRSKNRREELALSHPAKAPMDDATASGLLKMSEPEYRKFRDMERTGDDSAYREERAIEDESGGHSSKELPPNFAAWVEQKRVERAKVLETERYTGDIDKIATSRATDKKTELLGKAGTGDREAGKGLLYALGKDPVESAAKAVRAGADAEESLADAALRNRTNPNIRGGGAAGGARATTERLTSQQEQLRKAIDSERKALTDARSTARPAHESRIADLQRAFDEVTAELRARRSTPAAPSAAPAAKPASGASKGGSKWTKVG